MLSWATAYQLLHRVAKVKQGQCVLVHGAAGAVGQALITLGRLAGVKVWATAHGAHAELMRALGATPIDFEGEALPADRPGRFDAVFDGIGQRGFALSWASVKPGGVLAAYGFSAAMQEGGSLLKMGLWLLRLRLWNRRSNGKTAGFYSITALRQRHPEWYRTDLKRLFELLAKKAIRPRIAERIALENVPKAHRSLQAGGLEGKIMICP